MLIITKSQFGCTIHILILQLTIFISLLISFAVLGDGPTDSRRQLVIA